MLFHAVTVPEQPYLSVTSITATSISLFWSVPSDSVMTSSVVTWWKSGSDASVSVTVSEAHINYTITGLDSNTDYSVSVTVINGAGSATSSPILVSTSEVSAGTYMYIHTINNLSYCGWVSELLFNVTQIATLVELL